MTWTAMWKLRLRAWAWLSAGAFCHAVARTRVKDDPARLAWLQRGLRLTMNGFALSLKAQGVTAPPLARPLPTAADVAIYRASLAPRRKARQPRRRRRCNLK